MRHRRVSGMVIPAALLLSRVSSAYGGTVYVANTGTDGPSCGAKASPCRSIRQAIVAAVAGDKIIVGPGRYGDLNGNGVPGDSPGEESPTGCSCMLAIDKAVSITSSAGAAATVIDARTITGLNGTYNIVIFTDRGEFGRPGKGFTVTNTGSSSGTGILLESTKVAVQGNQVIATPFFVGGAAFSTGPGISALAASQDILIGGNQIIDWGVGVRVAGAGKRVVGNVLSRTGIVADGMNGTDLVAGNVVTAAPQAIMVSGTVDVIGNALYANDVGLIVDPLVFDGHIEKNNFVGSRTCGLQNGIFDIPGILGLPATHNYWGASTGPGSLPTADDVCNVGGVSTVTAPFATKPFRVKAPIKL